MLEVSAFFVMLFMVAGLYLVFERAINERKETVAFRAMESALGSGKRVTVSIGNGGQFPVRVEFEGLVFGFGYADYARLGQMLVMLPDTRTESVRVRMADYGGVLLSHPSLLARSSCR